MKFHIDKLIIWPKSNAFPPRIVDFKPGKVNVITGASRTGKSAIIPIIDYCLASSDCFIPIDTIRNYVSWYGIVFQTETEKILIARKVPEGPKVSNEFLMQRGANLTIPSIIEEANETMDGIKFILNTIAATPYFSLGNNDDQNFKARLGFRDIMALVFQSQEIVANQNILFYKTHSHVHRERLRNWFPFILGAETIDVLKARDLLKQLDLKLKKLRHQFTEINSVSDSWMANMLGHLNVAGEYGLLDEDISEETEPAQLLQVAKNILENIPNQSQTDLSKIEYANTEVSLMESKDEELSTKIGIIKKRLGDVQRLKSSFQDYGGGVRKRIDRLHISEWLKSVAIDSSCCPACGSVDHPNAAHELEKISLALEKYESASKRVAEIPTSFDREEEILKKELNDLLNEKNNHKQRFDLLMAVDKDAQQKFQQRKEMYLFLGHLRATLEIFERLSDGGDLQLEIQKLEGEYNNLIKTIDSNKIERLLKVATSKIAQNTLNRLQTLDVEDKYRKIAPHFSVKDLNISVLSDDGNWHFLAEVGSASNWVSFHLALMCGLQEFFLSQPASVVPSFVVFDQPSQVYFPKLQKAPGTEQDSKDEDIEYDDEDVKAVHSMFTTLANSVLESNGAWQAIVLDHAGSDIYGDIEGVYEVDIWRNGKKLIPEEWYSPKEEDQESTDDSTFLLPGF